VVLVAIAVLVATGKNRYNAEIGLSIAANRENTVRPIQKPFQCSCFVAVKPHFESMVY